MRLTPPGAERQRCTGLEMPQIGFEWKRQTGLWFEMQRSDLYLRLKINSLSICNSNVVRGRWETEGRNGTLHISWQCDMVLVFMVSLLASKHELHK